MLASPLTPPLGAVLVAPEDRLRVYASRQWRSRVASVFADVEWAGQAELETASRLLLSVGILVTPTDLEAACRAAGLRSSVVSHSPFATFYVNHARRESARDGIRAVYEVTDREIPREYRASAFARCRAQLLLRWIRGWFSAPDAALIRGWCVGATATDPNTWRAMDDAEPFAWPVGAQAVAA